MARRKRREPYEIPPTDYEQWERRKRKNNLRNFILLLAVLALVLFVILS